MLIYIYDIYSIINKKRYLVPNKCIFKSLNYAVFSLFGEYYYIMFFSFRMNVQNNNGLNVTQNIFKH